MAEFTVYCPRCDRPYTSTISKDDAVAKVSKHFDGQHPDMENPFTRDDGGD